MQKSLWFSHIGVRSGIHVSSQVIVGFQNWNGIDNEAFDNGFLWSSYVFSGQRNFGTERYPKTNIKLDYARKKYFWEQGELVS